MKITMKIYSTLISSVAYFDSKKLQLNDPRYILGMKNNENYINELLNMLKQQIDIVEKPSSLPHANQSNSNQLIKKQDQIQTHPNQIEYQIKGVSDIINQIKNQKRCYVNNQYQ